MSATILHVITTIDIGGAEKQLLSLATCQREKGYVVEVIFLKGEPRLLHHFLAADIRVRLEFWGENFIRQTLKLRKSKSREDSVIHAHLPRAELLCALALKSKTFVVTRHNAEAFFPSGPTFLSRFLSRFVLKRAFASISISKAVAKYLKTHGEISSSEDSAIIYYGLKDTLVRRKDSERPISNSFHIGTISRLVPQKNLALLLSVFKELSSVPDMNFQLSIVGTGPMGEELHSICRGLGIEHQVSWLGQCQNVSDFYSSIDTFVLSSNYEGFGLVLLEAMSHGIPIIARRISAIPEVLGDQHPGLIDSSVPLDYSRRIKEFADDKNLRRRCLEYQATRLKYFSIERTQMAHESIYSRLLQKRNF